MKLQIQFFKIKNTRTSPAHKIFLEFTCVCAAGYGEGLQTGLLVISLSHPQCSACAFCIIQTQL